jgi:hypothetical protein
MCVCAPTENKYDDFEDSLSEEQERVFGKFGEHKRFARIFRRQSAGRSHFRTYGWKGEYTRH